MGRWDGGRKGWDEVRKIVKGEGESERGGREEQ